MGSLPVDPKKGGIITAGREEYEANGATFATG